MYVVKRTDKEYGFFTKEHETFDLALEEAIRLANKHATEKPEFTIYELKQAKIILTQIQITMS